MALAWAAHHWKYCFREQRSLVTFAYNRVHIVPRNLVNRVVGAHFLFIVLKQRNHEVNLPLARPHCPAMAGRRRAAEPAGVVPNTAPRWQAQKWSGPSRYARLNLPARRLSAVRRSPVGVGSGTAAGTGTARRPDG